MKEVPPQPKGYQTQTCTQQPGLPNLVTFTYYLDGRTTCDGEEGRFRPPAKTRQTVKSRLTNQKESKHRVSDCSSPTMKVLGYKQEVRYFLGYY